MPNSVDDPAGLRDRLENQFDLLDDADIDDRDRDALRSWATTMLANDKALNTVTNRLNPARKVAERADAPLVDLDLDAVMALLVALGDGSHDAVPDDGLADGTMRQYRQALRLFFRDQLGREWAEQIEIGAGDRPAVDEGKILTTEDVDALLDAASRPRDLALLSFLLVTGQRITAALSIKVGDVDLSDQVGTVELNDDAIGLKGASGPRPLLWSRPYVSSWLEVHPDRGDDDAPLFCCVQAGRRPKADGSWVEWAPGDPLSRDQIKNRFRDLAEAAGLDPKKLKPHNLRHTAITRMRDQGVPDDRIKFMVGVSEDSTILERYDQADEDKMLSRLRSDHGVADPADASPSVGAPSMTECNQCAAPLRGSARFCPGCGQPLDAEAAAKRESSGNEVADDMVELRERVKREIARDALARLDESPEFAEDVVEEFD